VSSPEPSEPPVSDHPVQAHIVLVVEDEILIRLAIADHLRDAGLTVYEAANGTEAIDLLTHHGRDIDAIFSDIMMPGAIDGLALLSWTAQHYPDLPVILTSGVLNHDTTTDRLNDAGCFFLKPYSMDRVAALLTAKAKARAQARDDRATS
jgi:two-component system, response regulator PdtaR